jgi:hypothetical protein
MKNSRHGKKTCSAHDSQENPIQTLIKSEKDMNNLHMPSFDYSVNANQRTCIYQNGVQYYMDIITEHIYDHPKSTKPLCRFIDL